MKKQFILFLVLAWGCSPAQKKEDAASTSTVSAVLDATTFKENLSFAGTNAVLLDVRTPEEVAAGIIPGAVNIDFTAPDFAEKIAGLDKDKTYYVYCKVGGRSAKAIDKMKGTGFKSLYNLEGGYDAWVQKGFETQMPE